MSTETTPTGVQAAAVPPEILAWADEQDFRAATRRAISSLRVKPTWRDRKTVLWHAVAEVLAVGSTYASRYCILFGFDPDEEVRHPR